MTISRKPKAKAQPDTDDAAIEAVISKGGSVASTKKAGKSAKVGAVVVRIPATLLNQIDHALKARPIKKPRHTWILEAISEKLERESN